MQKRVIEFIVGLLFGTGLIVAGMTDPSKVLGFLDLAGLWDPSLAFVMGGGILVGLGAFAIAKKRTTTFLGEALQWGKEAMFGRTGPRGGQYDGLVQNVVKGEMRRMGRELVRGVLGGLIGGKKR